MFNIILNIASSSQTLLHKIQTIHEDLKASVMNGTKNVGELPWNMREKISVHECTKFHSKKFQSRYKLKKSKFGGRT